MNAAMKISAPFSATTVARTTSRQPLRVSALGAGQEYAATLPGITTPFSSNNGYWDPAGLCSEYTTVDEVRRWREAELTHGRVSMLAAVGFLVGENIEDFPLFNGVVTGPAVTQFQQLPTGFWQIVLFVIGLAEAYRVSLGWATPDAEGFNKLKPEGEYTMGELNFDPLGQFPTDEDEIYELKTKELNNGRLAMIAIAGFVAQEFAEKGPPVEIFEHLFATIESDIVYEVEKVEQEVEFLASAGQ